MSRKYDQGKANPLGGDVGAVDAVAYGTIDLPDSGRRTARPIPLELIGADPRQPRRVVPAAVRAACREPENITALLMTWRDMASARAGKELWVKDFIHGADPDVSSDDPITLGYLEVIRLAASILSEGLINPIKVVRHGDRYLIESGERRWMAHHLLLMQGPDQWDRILAVEVRKLDVWAQAAENGARAPLNAIGMARQLALLVMDMYEGERGVKWDAYANMVVPGGCDRKFYAQVKDGNVWPIKRGYGERVLAVTGLKSKSQIAHYRALLDVPDSVWTKADEQDWSEFKIREYVSASVPKTPDRFTTVNPHEKKMMPTPQNSAQPGTPNPYEVPQFAPVPAFAQGDAVEFADGTVGEIAEVRGRLAVVYLADGQARTATTDRLTLVKRAAEVVDSDKAPSANPAQTLGGPVSSAPAAARTGDVQPLVDAYEQKSMAPLLRAIRKAAAWSADPAEGDEVITLMDHLLSVSEADANARTFGQWEDYHLKGIDGAVERAARMVGAQIGEYVMYVIAAHRETPEGWMGGA